MFRSIIILALLVLGTAYNPLLAQTDDEQINRAANAISVTHNCIDALKTLEKVTPKGKMTANYFYTVARAHDCRANNEQAIYYYAKYLELKPANDSVKLRLAELKDNTIQVQRSNNEGGASISQYKSSPQAATKRKKKEWKIIDDAFINQGVGYVAGLGKHAPYKAGMNSYTGYGVPILKNEVLIDIAFNFDYMLAPNKTWLRNALQLPSTENVFMGTGIGLDIEVGILPILINEKNIALAAGPVIAGKLFFISDANSNYYTYSIESKNVFSVSYGLRSNLYLGEAVTFYVDYSRNTLKDVTINDRPVPGSSYDFKTSLDILRLGIGYRFLLWY